MKLPQISQSSCIVSHGIAINKCLVFGWIKELFESSNFEDLAIPPMDIIQMIYTYCNDEMIHWLQRGSGTSHGAIESRYILQLVPLKELNYDDSSDWDVIRQRNQVMIDQALKIQVIGIVFHPLNNQVLNEFICLFDCLIM